jgi:hypothetical protein
MSERDEQLLVRIHQLATGQLEGTLGEDERAALRELLAQDAEARRLYVEHMQDTVSLRWICSGHCDRRRLLAAGEAGRRPHLLSYVPAWGVHPVTWAAAAALLLVAAVATHAVKREDGRAADEQASAFAAGGEAGHDVGAGSASAGVAAGDAGGRTVATLTRASSVEWGAPAEAPNLLSRIAVGQQLQFGAGTVELTFDTGAQVKIFGPAKIEVSSPRSILCSLGRVTTLVGKSGRGFTIDTPMARIVDLGTEFGVNISDKGDTQVIVFQGSVDLTRSTGSPAAAGASERGAGAGVAEGWTRRMTQGDALLLDDTGQAQRVVAVQRGDFFPSSAPREYGVRRRPPVIVGVEDNIRSDESAKCYQIVHGGLREDALSFVDRAHQWNGVTEAGLPEFLQDADYIMPFNDDKFISNLEVKLKISRPATCYVFLDDNMARPEWLTKSFKDTGVDVGLDGAKTEWHRAHSLGEGPGESVDFIFSVWSRDIDWAGTISLGGVEPPKIGARSSGFNMYGIAVVPK